MHKIRIHSWDAVDFRVLWPEQPQQFLTTPTPNILQSTFNFLEFASACINQAISSFCSKDIFNLKILWSDWPRALYPISQQTDFSRLWNFRRNMVDNKNFHWRPTFSINSENPIFGPFSPFLGWNFFIKNPAVTNNFICVSKTMPKFRKN